MRFCFRGQLIEMLFFFSLAAMIFQFPFLVFSTDSLVAMFFFAFFQYYCFSAISSVASLMCFLRQLYLQLLHFHFFIDRFKLTVIFYVAALLVIFFDQRLRFFNSFIPLRNNSVTPLTLPRYCLAGP